MNESSGWARFLSRQIQSPPLRYVTGMCNTACLGVCCVVHSHRSLEIVYHPTGRGCTRLPDRKLAIPFQEQAVVIYAPEEQHDQVMDAGGEDLCVQIAIPTARARLLKGCLCIPHIESPSLIDDMRLLSHGHTRLSPAEQSIFNLRATATLLALLHLHCTASEHDAASQPEKYVLLAEQYIHDHLLQIESIAQVAEHAGVSPHYLRHLFKARRGKSLIRHITELRIDRAKSLLSHSQLPMKQIAALCGFKDEYYFSAVFHSFTQLAPGRYRRLHR